MSDLEVFKYEPVFVSAVSDDHVHELKTIMLPNVNEAYAELKKKVVVYDIGSR